jgi:hypothetical protein
VPSIRAKALSGIKMSWAEAPRMIPRVDMKLRQPVFLGLRDDKRPQDVFLPELLRMKRAR